VPRLAPDGVRCKENRITTGTAERKLMAALIKENRKDRVQKYVSSFAIPISILGLGFSIGIAGYFMAPSVIQDAKDKAKEVKETIQNLTNNISGKKPVDPSTGRSAGIQTALCVDGPAEGQVVTNKAAGIIGLGGIVGWINNFVTTAVPGKNTWVPIWGNYNRDAMHVSELSKGWYYLDVETGGPLL